MPNYGLPPRDDAAEVDATAAEDGDSTGTVRSARNETQDGFADNDGEAYDARQVSPADGNSSREGGRAADSYGENVALSATGAALVRGAITTVLLDESSSGEKRCADGDQEGGAGSGKQREGKEGWKTIDRISGVAGTQRPCSRERRNCQPDHHRHLQQAVREDSTVRAVAHDSVGLGGAKAGCSESGVVPHGSLGSKDNSYSDGEGVDTQTARSEKEQTSGIEEGDTECTGGAGAETAIWTERRKGEGAEGEDKKGAWTGSRKRLSTDALNAGRAVVCRGHALEGMVYLGQR